MKPLKLSIEAFGPFAGSENLDFGDLGSHKLFLIHGKTGAGKTSILDALCFALFGDTTGGERDGRGMRSHHASPEQPTRVSLEFALGSDVYRVERSPEQERPKKRGDGVTKELQQATLWRVGGEGAEGQVVAAGWLKVNEAVASLLGYSCDEFRQVVVLPQGRFRRLLVADSSERERILETLFHTERYRALERQLSEQAKDLAKNAQKVLTKRSALLEQARVETLEGLEDLREGTRADLNAANAAVKQAVEAAVAADKVFREAQSQAAKREELGAAQALLQKRKAESKAAAPRRERLAGMRRALRIEPQRLARDRSRDEAKEAGLVLEAAKKHALAATKALKAAQSRLGAAQLQAKELDQLRRKRDQLQNLLEEASSLEPLTEALAALDRSFADAKGAIGWSNRSISGLEAKQKKFTEQSQRCLAVLSSLELRKHRALEAEQYFQMRRELEGLRATRMTALVAVGAAESEQEKATLRLREAKNQSLLLERAWREGRAAALASELEDGSPCPVCGSREHPQPAAAGEDAGSGELLDQSRKAVEDCEGEVAKASEKTAAAKRLADKLKLEVESIEGRLGEAGGKTLAELEADLTKARSSLAEAGKADVELREVKPKLEKVEADLAEDREELAAETSRLQALNTEQAELRGRLEEKQKALPKELREPGALALAVVQAVDAVSLRESAVADAEAQAVLAGEEAAKAQALASQAVADCDKAARSATEELRAFEEQLAVQGFDDEAAFQDARGSEAEIDNLEAGLEKLALALAEAAGREDRAREAALGLPEVLDVAAKEQDARAAAEARDQAQAKAGGLEQALASLEAVAKTIQQLDEQTGDLQERYAVVGRVAEVMAGRGANSRGIPFQRFVLAAFLDDVLVSASQRLRLMSNQRYVLRRSEERGSRARTTGLELVVFDAYTGQDRAVSTLSGGEGFLASLALALGLSDVVQSYSGGIRLETIFIDEGFGTLDPEALDLAMRALVDLQNGGRLVGVISHVPELRERIAARLEVSRAADGSQARIVCD